MIETDAQCFPLEVDDLDAAGTGTGSYLWTTPHRQTWLVTTNGTFPQHAA